jgi:hypothetical protein
MFVITEIDKSNKLIQDLKYRLKAVMWSEPKIQFMDVHDFPHTRGGRTFGLMYLLRKNQNVKTKSTTFNENKSKTIGIKRGKSPIKWITEKV